MSHIIVVRGYKPGDELYCREIFKEAIMSTVNTAFVGNLCKEITFQMMILCSAIMFIFFGMPFSFCFLIIPIGICSTYMATYLGFVTVAAQVNQELTNIPRMYMSNAFSCFWVAEAYQPFLMTRNPKDVHYNVMTEKQFREANIDVSSQAKRIVGTIGLVKSHKVEKGAWVKRLCVHKDYRRKGVGSCLINTALQFAINEGYGCVDLVFSEYADGGRDLCFKRGFELKQMYHRPIVGIFVSVLAYEFSHQIKRTYNYSSDIYQRNTFRTD